MSVTPSEMIRWCQVLLDVDNSRPERTLADYLNSIPKLDSLANLPSGTSVLVRGDVDAKPGLDDRRGRHSPALDERDAQLRPRPRLEADHLRPHRPQARGVAGQGRRATGRDSPAATCRSSPTGSTNRR